MQPFNLADVEGGGCALEAREEVKHLNVSCVQILLHEKLVLVMENGVGMICFNCVWHRHHPGLRACTGGEKEYLGCYFVKLHFMFII